jgi:hypothetical protein
MCKREENSRTDDSGYHVSARPILKYPLNETAIDKLFTHCHSDNQCEKYQALNIVLGKQLESKLWQDAFDFRRFRYQTAETIDLIDRD